MIPRSGEARNRTPEGLRRARAFACPPPWGLTPAAFLVDPPQQPSGFLSVLGLAPGRGGPNYADLAVLWNEKDVSAQTLSELQGIEARLGSGADHDLLLEWWEVVCRAIDEREGGSRWSERPAYRSLGQPAAPGPGHGVDLGGLWRLARERHERVATAWTDLVCDPLAALTHCALFDVANPSTAAFISAYGRAGDFLSVHGTEQPRERALVDEYADLARSAETTWRTAVTRAERTGFEWLPEDQRADAERASRLLALASSESAPLAERASAAERASVLLRRIHAVVLPDTAMQALDALRRPELEGPAPEGPDLTGPAAP